MQPPFISDCFGRAVWDLGCQQKPAFSIHVRSKGAVHVDVWIVPALQGAVAPVLDVDVGFLVQLADGGGRDLAAPQRLGDVLHPAYGDARQVHLDERLLHAALPAAIPPGVAVSKDTPLSRGTWSVTSPEVVVRFLS